jgi:hypothetical protein
MRKKLAKDYKGCKKDQQRMQKKKAKILQNMHKGPTKDYERCKKD